MPENFEYITKREFTGWLKEADYGGLPGASSRRSQPVARQPGRWRGAERTKGHRYKHFTMDEIKELFRTYDRNNSNTVTYTDLCQIIDEIGVPSSLHTRLKGSLRQYYNVTSKNPMSQGPFIGWFQTKVQQSGARSIDWHQSGTMSPPRPKPDPKVRFMRREKPTKYPGRFPPPARLNVLRPLVSTTSMDTHPATPTTDDSEAAPILPWPVTNPRTLRVDDIVTDSDGDEGTVIEVDLASSDGKIYCVKMSSRSRYPGQAYWYKKGVLKLKPLPPRTTSDPANSIQRVTTGDSQDSALQIGIAMSLNDMANQASKKRQAKDTRSWRRILVDADLAKYIERFRDSDLTDTSLWNDLSEDELKKEIGFTLGALKRWRRLGELDYL